MQALVKSTAFWVTIIIVAAVIWYLGTNHGYNVGMAEAAPAE